MVSVVSGSGLGLVNTSRGVVGASGELGQGSLGRAGERVTVNAANGNLVVQNQDGLLVGVGADVGLLRTYNSLGGWDGDNGDAWRLGYYRRIGGLTGTLNAAGSSLVRTDADGFESTYTWRDGRYVGTDGAGAYDTLVIDANSATWTDGDTGLTETYSATAGGAWRLTQITDPEGHALRVAYDTQGLIASLSTWKAGAISADETLTLVYDGNRHLTQVSTSTRGTDGSLRTQTRVAYSYDSAGRLASVVTDLSPEDNSTADGRTYSVTYGYDSAGRLRTLAQTDGSALTIDYDDAGRVRRITDALGHATTFGYDTAARQTSVTDALGQVARLAYDSAGRLGELSGTGFKTSFAYDNEGNLLSSTNGLGQQTVFGYDGRGNLIRSTDASGRVLERSFDAANRQTGETQYAQPGVGQTTRYVYDTSGGLRRLRFSVSAEGRVTEQQYNALGQVGSSIAYTRSAYGGAATLADLTAWAGQQAGAQRTDYSYDLRGQLASRTDAAGLTRYTYDPFGRLLQSIDANGNTTAYAYDGLDRLLLSTDALGAVTTTSYDDAGYRTSVLAANGLRTVSTYNTVGLLVAQTQYNGSTALGETRYTYDAANRLRMTQGPTGQRQWMLYDEAGRLVGEVDALGHLGEYRYDAAGRLVQTIGYEQAANTALLLDAQGQPANVSLAAVRPAASANDRRQWQLFDAAGRLTHQVNGLGEVTETQYDGAGRIAKVIQHGQRLAALPAVGSSDLPVLTYAAADDPDRITRSLYDADGLLRGTLGAEGGLTEMRYDAVGHLVERIAYATATEVAQRAAGTLSQLLPATTPADRRSVWLYDTLGRQVAEIDPDGWLTETTYNTAGQRTQNQRYARRISGSATPASTLAGLRPAASAEDQRTAWTYDALNRVVTETSADGTVTRYGYDNVGNLTSTERAAGTAEARRRTQRYDLQGRLVAELSGEGSAKLAQATTQAQIDAVWNTYATQHAYDTAGRRIRSTDARGSTTVYYFDATGRLAYTILKTDRGGEVQASRYNGFGEAITNVRYARRLSTADTATLTGGQADAALDAKIATLADGSEARLQASYNQRGLIQQAIDALGFKTTSSYDAFGQLSRSEAETGDGRVLRTDYSHDRRGLLTATVQDPLSLAIQTRTEYDAFGRVTAGVDARGYRSTTQYVTSDGAPDSGRQVVLTDPTGASSRITYDAFDRVIRQTDALGHSTTFNHDTANRRVTMTTADGIVTVTESTRHGQVAKVIDGTGATTTYSYDKNGNLQSRTDALGNVTSSSYDAVDNLATQSAAGTLTRHSYDAANRLLTRQVDPDGLNLRTTYEYDGQGRAIKVTDGAGTVTSYRFDAKGELVETVEDDTATGLKLRTATTYDAQGRTLSVTEGAGTAAAKATEYRYDILGRRVQEIVDPAGLKLTTVYEYDAMGNVVLRRDAVGAVTRYAYDAAGRQRFTIDAEGYLSEQRYDAAGRVTSTLRYDRRFKLSATPTEAELVSATRSQTTQFTSDLEGFAGSAGVWDAGRLKLISQPLPDGNWAGMNSSLTLAAGASFKFELTPNELQQTLHAGVVASGTPYARLAALFGPDGHIRAQTYDATIGTWAYQDLGTYSAGTTYTVEIATTDTGGTLTVYPKNAGRAAAYSYTYTTTPDASWQNVRLFFATQTYPSIPGTTTAYVDNIEERSAGVQATRYVYDAAGRQRFTIDAEGYLSEQRYDAAGRVTSTLRYDRRFKLSATPTEAELVSATRSLSTQFTSGLEGFDGSAGVWDAGRLKLISQPLPNGNWAAMNSSLTLAAGASFKFELTPNELQQTLHAGVVASGTPYARLAALFGPDGHIRAQTYDAITGNWAYQDLGTYSAGITYTVEITTTDTGGTLTVYQKNTGRAAAYSYTYTTAPDAGWQNVRLFFATQTYPSIPGTTTAYVDNIEERSAGVQATRYVYDAAGRQRFTIDAEGYLSEQRYDAAGRVTSTLRYDRCFKLSATPTEAELVSATRSQTTQFTSGLEGFAGSAGVWDAGRLKLISQPLPDGNWAGMNSSLTLAAGASFKFELTPNELQQTLHAGVVASGTPYARLAALFGPDGHIRAQTYDAITGNWAYQDLGTYSAGITYTVEITTTDTGGTLTVYPKNAGRAAAYSYTYTTAPDAGWQNVRLFFATQTYPSIPGTTTAYVDNIEERSAGVQATRYVYDAAGRQRFTIDAEGYLSEQRYDAAGRVTSTLRYDRRFKLSATPTEAELVSATRSLSTQFTSSLEGFEGSAGVWDSGRLKLISQPLPDGSWAGATSSLTLAAGASFKFELTPNELQQTLHAGVVASGTPYARLAALFGPDGHIRAQTYDAITGNWAYQDLGTYSAGITYTVEITTTDTGGTLTVYPKNAGRAAAYSYTYTTAPDAGWQNVRLFFATQTYPSIPGTTTAYVDNIEERSAGVQATRYVYDAAGRQRFTIDAEGYLSEQRYDATGRVTSTLRYDRRFKLSATPTEAELVSATRSQTTQFTSGLEGFDGNAGVWEAGRLKLISRPLPDGNWAAMNSSLTLAAGASFKFELTPNELQQTLHAGVVASGTPYARLAALFNPDGHILAQTYDAITGNWAYQDLGTYSAGITYTVEITTTDTGGTLTVYPKSTGRAAAYSYTYVTASDANWQNVRLFFATQTYPSIPGTTTAYVDNIEERAAGVQVTRYVYDATNHPLYQQDPLGYLTKTRYNPAGQVIEQIRYATPIPTTTVPTQDAFTTALLPDPSFDRPTRYVYDSLGQLRFTVDALGGVTESLYDAFGHVARTVAHDTPIPYASVTDATTPDALRALLPASTLNARETLTTYDAAGRVVHTARAQATSGTAPNTTKLFTVTENQYDALGHLTRTLAYSTPVALQDLPPIPTARQLADKLAPLANPAADRITLYAYDATGRLLRHTDGEGYSEQYAYDAWGRKTRFTNKNGAVFDYEYDRLGRLLAEWSPAVEVTRLDSALNLIADASSTGTTGPQRIQTRTSYDAWGQLLSRTEAWGRPEARTTRYEYDALGRQVRTLFEPVDVYDASLDNLATNGLGGAAVSRTETRRTLVAETAYNAFGQAVASRDTSGNTRYKTYDQLGRLLNEIDANHQVTQHLYSTRDGEYTQTTRLGTAAVFADGLGVSSATLEAAAAAAAATSATTAGGTRNLRSFFDRLGRTQRVEDLLDAVYSYDSSTGQGGNWVRATTYEYTVWGDLKARSTLLDRAGANATPTRSATTWFAYDLQGGLTRQVDAEGYVTEHSRNAFGEDRQVTEYATRIDVATQGVAALPPASPASAAGTAALGHDRLTAFAYDRRGLQTGTRRLALQAGVRSGTTQLARQLGDLVNTITFDGVGNAVQTTSQWRDSVSGALLGEQGTTLNTYDALGRLTAVVAAESATSTRGRLTTTRYDALGNAVLTRRWATLSPGNAQLPAEAADDQVTRQAFDRLGRVLQVRDALGNDRFFSYDAAGHAVKQWAAFSDADGLTRNAIQTFSYDKTGRQTETRTLVTRLRTDSLAFSTESAIYNAFGEITTKARDGVVFEQNTYDNAGRLWKTNAGDGVFKIHWYDLQDNVSASFVSNSTTLDLASVTSPQALAALPADKLRRTSNTYDRLQHVLRQQAPAITHADGTVTSDTTAQVFDAWGNVLAVSRNGSQRTQYRYNSLDQAIEETQLNATAWSASGSSSTANLTKSIFYDAWGHNIGSMDAAGNANAASYNFFGQIEREYHADAGQVAYSYDAFGRLGAKADEVGRTWLFSYDKANRETGRQVDVDALGTGTAPYQLTQSSYDALGNKVTETSGQDSAYAGAVRKYTYDARGLLIRSQAPGSQVTEFWYDAAGRKTRERDGNGLEVSWGYDSGTGRLNAHTDLGGATYSYTYGNDGQVLTQTSSRGQSLGYDYYGNGALKQLSDGYLRSNTQYDYDAEGHRSREIFTSNGTVYRDLTNLYDGQGRLVRATDKAAGVRQSSGNLYELNIGYDAVGNRRRVWGTAQSSTNSAGQAFDDWYTYDGMNRVRINGGDLVAGSISEVGARGVYVYDAAGRRRQETTKYNVSADYTGPNGSRLEFSYDFADRLTRRDKVFLSGSSYADGARNLEKEISYAENGVQTEVENVYDWNTTVNYKSKRTRITFNSNAQVTRRQDFVTGKASTSSSGNTTATAEQITGDQSTTYDLAGNVSALAVKGYGAQSGTLYDRQVRLTYEASNSSYQYSYVLMEGYKERGQYLTGQSRPYNGSWTTYVPSQSVLEYDANGNLVQVKRQSNGGWSAGWYLTDNAGHVTHNWGSQVAYWGGTAATFSQDGSLKRWTPATGALEGSAGVLAALPAAPAVADANNWNLQTTLYVNDQRMGAFRHYYSSEFDAESHTRFVDNDWGADIDITGLGSAKAAEGSGQTYTAQAGDTARALAQRFYGDASLWYVIADANALVIRSINGNSDASLNEGQAVKVPNVVRATNTATSFKVYDPSGLIGDTAPEVTMPPPPPPPSSGGGCGGLGMILVIAVAVVATVVTAGAAAVAMGAVASGTGVVAAGTAVLTGGLAGATLTATASALTVAAAAAVGGAVGSIASQGVAMAMGMQDHFSWKQVAVGALGAGVTSGMGQAGMFGGLARMGEYGQYAAMAANAATSNAITQGLAVATDLQDKFNWRAVTTSAMAAPAAQYLGGKVGGFVSGMVGGSAGQFAGEFAQRMTAGVVSQRIRMAVYNQGKLDYASIAADAFGQVVGQGLVDAMASDRNPLNGNYRNEMDRESDAYSPVSNYNYRNGSDVESDLAYEARREQEGSSQSDAIMGRRASEVLAASRALDRSIKDRALATANFQGTARQVWAQEDAETAARALAARPAEHARADAYARQLAQQAARARDEELQASINAAQMSAGPHGGAGPAYGDVPTASAAVRAYLRSVTSEGPSERPGMVATLLGGSSATFLRKDISPAEQQQIAGLHNLSLTMTAAGTAGVAGAPALLAAGEGAVAVAGELGAGARALYNGVRAFAADVATYGPWGAYLLNGSGVNTVGLLATEMAIGYEAVAPSPVLLGGGVRKTVDGAAEGWAAAQAERAVLLEVGNAGNVAPVVGAVDAAGEAVTVFRVQGGTPPLASRRLITIDANGNPVISKTTLNVSVGDPVHAEYFLSKRPGADITSFDIPKWMGDFIEEQAIPQVGYRTNPANQGGLAPKLVDPTTPGRSYELPDIWAKWLQEVAVPGSGKVKKGGTP